MTAAWHTKIGAARDVLLVGSLSINFIVPVFVDDSSKKLEENCARAIQQTATALEADFIYIGR